MVTLFLHGFVFCTQHILLVLSAINDEEIIGSQGGQHMKLPCCEFSENYRHISSLGDPINTAPITQSIIQDTEKC